jgi:hypothetical protein
MAEALSGSVSSLCKFQHTNSFGNIGYTGNPNKDYEMQFASTDITKIYFATLTVTTSTTTIDMTAAGPDAYGTAVAFATIKHLMIWNKDLTNSLTAGGGAQSLLQTLPVMGPTSCFAFTSPITVDTAHSKLNLVASAGSITVEVLAVGT